MVGLRDADLADLRGVTIHGNIVAGEERTPPEEPHKRAVIYGTGGTIEITGVITGAWTPIGSVDVTGVQRPGFSPGMGLVSAPSTVRGR